MLLGWWVDRSNLKKQIPPEPVHIVRTYRCTNASCDVAADTLNTVFETQVAWTFEKNNSVIINCEEKFHKQIRLMLQHIDRKGTEYVNAKVSDVSKTKLK